MSAARWREPRPSRAVVGAVTWLARAVVLPHLARVSRLDLPAADLARLGAVLRPGTAAFLAPNHPEFLTDAALDKELSARVSPLMAFWVSHHIVDANPVGRALWLRHTAISNLPGGDGRGASVRWALLGHGVLLHPEGTSSWQGGHVGPLLPGIAELARLARERAPGAPVWLVPVVWRLRFAGDVTAGLAREMGVVERALGLPDGGHVPVGERFAALTSGLLERRRAELGRPGPHVPAGGRGYFRAQAAAVTALRERLALPPGSPQSLARLMRGLHLARTPDERALWTELWRLEGFAPALYDRPALEPERIAESLKRLRTALVTRGWRHRLHNVLPRPVGDRVAHVRVPEPIPAHEWLAPGVDPAAAKERLLAALATGMQGALDALAAELEPELAPRRLANPLWSGGGR